MDQNALISLGFGKSYDQTGPQILVTHRDGIFVTDSANQGEKIPGFPSFEKGIYSKYSHDGKLLGVVYANCVVICCTSNGLILAQIDRSGVELVDFSPRSSFFVTIEKMKTGPNIHITNLASNNTLVGSLEAKGNIQQALKNMKWKEDESIFMRLVAASKIEIYETAAGFAAPRQIISLDVISTFELNPAKDCNLIAVSTYAINKPEDGMVRFYDYPGRIDKEKFRVKATGAQDIIVKFSPDGAAALLWFQTYVDNTGKSYYGQHELHYSQCLGGTKRCQVPIFDGQISDVQWAPNSQDFIVISGLQPAVATLFSKDCVPLFEFGKSYRNTIRYSPFSNFVCIAGFGNLVGDMDFWDKDSLERLGKNKVHCAVTCEWSPDGKYILTGVVHPRVRVDNEFRVLRYNGDLVFVKDMKHTQLFAVEWQPSSKEDFNAPDASPSTKLKMRHQAEALEEAKGTGRSKPHWHSSELSSLLKKDLGSKAVTGPRKLNSHDYDYLLEERKKAQQQQLQQQQQVQAKLDDKSPEDKISWRKTGDQKPATSQIASALNTAAVSGGGTDGQQKKKKRGKKKKKEEDTGGMNDNFKA